MKKFNFLSGVTILLLLLGTTSTAQAGLIHSYTIDAPGGSNKGGKIHNITTSYDVDNQIFNWSHTINRRSNGFWLVVSDGPNPKGNVNEYAILYGDLNANKLTAYQYNGQNNDKSWKHQPLLDHWAGLMDITTSGNKKTVEFALNASSINHNPSNADWDGVAFGEKIGIWFHPSRGASFKYNADGSGAINSFRPGKVGYYDTGNKTTTTAVPEPATPLLFAAGLLSLMGFARKKKNA